MSKAKAIGIMTIVYLFTPIWATYFYVAILYDVIVNGNQSLLCKKVDECQQKIES